MDIRKKKLLGSILTAVGVTSLASLLFFLFFGFRFLVNQGLEFEPEQILNSQPASQIVIPGFTGMTIYENTTEVATHLYNPQDNACYFKIIITLAGTEEVLYESKLIAPGQDLYTIELTRELEAGEYDAIISYTTYAVSDYTEMNGAIVPFTLHVVE